MSKSPLRDVVAHQYERWQYPEPILDLPGWLANNWQWFDPSHAHRLFWPDRPYANDLSVLVAGCGTNQAAVLAYTNPGAHVVAIDVSQASLEHHRFLRDTYGLRNLELHLQPIEEVATLNRAFDLIVCTGVLHHLSSPATGLQALSACLKPDGVAAIMLYAHYGRIGVEILQALFRELGLEQNEASLVVVKEALAALPQDHPIQSYLALAPDLQFDAGLVDTFLHGRDRSYTVDDCLELVEGAGLVFQDWLFKALYTPPAADDNTFFRSVAALPTERQWSVMERLHPRNACHFFVACRPERRPESYRISFAGEASLHYVPLFRYRCALENAVAIRPGSRLPLEPLEQALLQHVDGRRSIAEILAQATAAGAWPTMPDEERHALGRRMFARLWQADVLAMAIQPGSSPAPLPPGA